jgi:poly(A) polymerase/tRNA nucleotidyltransferase (CCA-adding enzyme)
MERQLTIPPEVREIAETLQKSGFEAYVVGGCVRDLLIGKKPKDWDLTTNATPEQIQGLFEKTFYENDYGTVGVETGSEEETLKIVEITPYRIESGYSDNRRPDEVKFSTKIEDDLKRRDFTINAIAYNPLSGEVIDLYKGQNDLKDGIIRAVGDPEERFREDGLRILRAVRFYAQLGFKIEENTENAVKNTAELLKNISLERIRDEFSKIISSSRPAAGLEKAREVGILKFIAPELEEGWGIEQNQAHAYDVWTHLMKSLQCAADKNYPFHVRLAALFHDISKPATRRRSEEKGEWTFYGHEVVGSRVTRKILERLKFSHETIEKVTKLVRWHMFFSDTEQITLSAVRRMVANVGKENVWELMDVRVCDRVGTGRPKENPYRLRKYRAMIEEAMRDPLTVGMLAIDGNVLMGELHMKPGPKIGYVLHALLEEVLDDPKRNTKEYLSKRASELLELPDAELEKIGKQGKEKKDEEEQKTIEEIRKKYWVK